MILSEQNYRSAIANTSKVINQALRSAWTLNPSISLVVLFSFIALVLSTLGLVVDHRLISGDLAWLKPFKFSISLLLYGSSLIFISRFLTQGRLLLKATSLAALIGVVIELSAIFVQAFRGAPSHFNLATPIDTLLWYMIKFAIMPVAFAIIAMLFMLNKEKQLPAVMGAAIRWGALLTVVGFIPGFLMLMPESLQHVFTDQIMSGHTVGLAAASQKIPFIGWSAVVGDLRTAHFVGLHALQVLPFFGYVIDKTLVDLSLLKQRFLVSISGFTYFALILLLTWQALRGESIVAPGVQTVSFYFMLAFASLGSSALVLLPIRFAQFAELFSNGRVVLEQPVNEKVLDRSRELLGKCNSGAIFPNYSAE